MNDTKIFKIRLHYVERKKWGGKSSKNKDPVNTQKLDTILLSVCKLKPKIKILTLKTISLTMALTKASSSLNILL